MITSLTISSILNDGFPVRDGDKYIEPDYYGVVMYFTWNPDSLTNNFPQFSNRAVSR